MLWACLLAAILSAVGCAGGGSPAVQPSVFLSSQSVNFGDTAVETTTTMEVTIFNEGTSSVSLQQSAISGQGFEARGIGQGVTLPQGQYVTLVVSFNPPTVGNMGGMISLSSNVWSTPVNILLSGAGINPTHSVALDWDASTSDEVVGYNIYCKSDAGGWWTKVNSTPVPTTSYTDWDVQGGGSYLFAITTVQATNDESILSDTAWAVIPSP